SKTQKIGYLGIILILSTKSKTTLYKKFNSIHCVCKMHLLGGHPAKRQIELLSYNNLTTFFKTCKF
ncbi:hypothetical protein, partial [Silvanigrella sp.]|uniref:hypothetical protein n=1 Tax=Silvanigrella sp. TaxID=2024976 RepID=UPI0037C6318A